MPLYRINTNLRRYCTIRYEVEAPTEEAAREIYYDGDAQMVDEEEYDCEEEIDEIWTDDPVEAAEPEVEPTPDDGSEENT